MLCGGAGGGREGEGLEEVAFASQTPATRPPQGICSHPRVWPATVSPQDIKYTALHITAQFGYTPSVEALLNAGADAVLKDGVRDGAEGRGRPRGLGGEWRGGFGGKGPCRCAAPPLRAAHSRRPLPPRWPPAPPPLPRFPVGRMAKRRWTSPRRRSTRRSWRSWRTSPPSQRRSARVRLAIVSI